MKRNTIYETTRNIQRNRKTIYSEIATQYINKHKINTLWKFNTLYNENAKTIFKVNATQYIMKRQHI